MQHDSGLAGQLSLLIVIHACKWKNPYGSNLFVTSKENCSSAIADDVGSSGLLLWGGGGGKKLPARQTNVSARPAETEQSTPKKAVDAHQATNPAAPSLKHQGYAE